MENTKIQNVTIVFEPIPIIGIKLIGLYSQTNFGLQIAKKGKLLNSKVGIVRPSRDNLVQFVSMQSNLNELLSLLLSACAELNDCSVHKVKTICLRHQIAIKQSTNLIIFFLFAFENSLNTWTSLVGKSASASRRFSEFK